LTTNSKSLYTGAAPRTALRTPHAITGVTRDSAITAVPDVFESLASESAFPDVADEADDAPIVTTNAEVIAEHGVLGDAWTLPPPYSLERRPLALTYQVQQ